MKKEMWLILAFVALIGLAAWCSQGGTIPVIK